MKTIYQIAKTELQTLFYSPVAWFLLVVFSIQTFLGFTGSIETLLRSQQMGWGFDGDGVTNGIYSHPFMGFLGNILQVLYLYVPLLTMGLMSREIGSGSIKLLYSSPVSNLQIILGKYVSMMVYGLVLVAVILITVLIGAYFIPNFDHASIYTALLGFYLLICTYAAIGLFMSCLTSYQVVAAIATLAMLFVLNAVRGWGQKIDFVRDITYWFGIPGRANNFVINGMICSEDVLYFIVVAGLFLSLAVIRLNANRQKTRWTVSIGKYVGVIALCCLLGYLSSRPKLMTFYDATETKRNTLTEKSQQVVGMLDEKLTVTMYDNGLDTRDIWTGLPTARMNDKKFWERYTRFKPDIKLKYVLYYDSIPGQDLRRQFPNKVMNTLEDQLGEICRIYNVDSTMFKSPEEIRKEIDLLPEGNKFVRLLESGNGKNTFLRVFNDQMHVPSEREITAAFKRLVMELPVVGFAVGQGQRGYEGDGDRDYNFARQKDFRYALINQGFDVAEVNFAQGIPDSINIVVIAELRRPFDAEEQANFDQYLARGGNMYVIAEPRRREAMTALLAQFGVRQLPGTLVKTVEPPSKESVNASAPVMVAVGTLSASGSISLSSTSTKSVKKDEKVDTAKLKIDTTKLKIDTTKLKSTTPKLTTATTTLAASANESDTSEADKAAELALLKTGSPDLVLLKPTPEAIDLSFYFAGFGKTDYVTMLSASPLEYDTDKGFEVIPLFKTFPIYWNEMETTDFVDDTVTVNPAIGEVQQSYCTGLALSRQVGEKTQKVMIFSDSDCLSNSELNMYRRGIRSRNFSIITAGFYWMSDEEVPIDVRRPDPKDTQLKMSKETLSGWGIALHWVFPALLVITYLLIWIRRKSQ
ncbi:MAG: Gldg family protein [Dysgonamonadaceae bacterium]|jgi:ABC-2 type transport system permease protein|nr:Gldg family protein [Dysgonamonadaceae bacterium]